MKIKSIKLKDFKRFTDLSIEGLPETAKLVVMIGPNGSGKSSVFDAIQSYSRGMNISHHDNYYAKSDALKRPDIEFHESTSIASGLVRVRSAYRNDPTSDRTRKLKMTTMVQNDQSFSSNCNTLLNQWLNRTLGGQHNETLGRIREEVFGKLRRVMNKLFEDLKLDLNITRKAKHKNSELFYFKKGISRRLPYNNLASGERACFDLILDMIVFKKRANAPVLFCIDEPEAHIHTKLQGQLLEELYNLIRHNSQLWIATHSIGMVRKAQDLWREDPDSVVFLDFGKEDSGQDRNFDEQVTIKPAKPNPNLWTQTYSVALGDLSELIASERYVFCEGNDFDAECYHNIFASHYPETRFISIGGRNNVEKVVTALKGKIAKGAKVIGVVDRDRTTDAEIKRNIEKDVHTLKCGAIEDYLLDDEVLKQLCISQGKSDKVQEFLAAKDGEIKKITDNDKIHDKRRPIVQRIQQLAETILELTHSGNTVESFMKDVLAPLIQPGMKVYEKLHEDIFGELTHRSTANSAQS